MIYGKVFWSKQILKEKYENIKKNRNKIQLMQLGNKMIKYN